MKNLKQLEKRHEKEKELAKRHVQQSDDIQKQIEQQRGNMMHKAINRLNLTADEFAVLLKLLSEKQPLMEATSLIMAQREKKGTGKSEQVQNT